MFRLHESFALARRMLAVATILFLCALALMGIWSGSTSLWVTAAGALTCCVAYAMTGNALPHTATSEAKPRSSVQIVACAEADQESAKQLLGIAEDKINAELVEPGLAVARALETGSRQVCIHMPNAGYEQKRSLLADLVSADLTPLVVEADQVPGGGRPSLRRMKIDDLLGRPSAGPAHFGVRDLITKRVVMVTGAGGSIGSELCRQIACLQPSLLVLVEQNEYSLYSIDQQLRDAHAALATVAAVADVKNAPRLGQIVQRYSPAVIFHAAAYKHVPLMEDVNAWEALRNNVLGTYVVARAAIESGVEKFVLVSTDKAVNPTNVMGVSKRLAEMVCQALQQTTPVPRFEMVRFGNVLGSAGSVIPRFEEQIARGGPVTVTHPDMVRYFMSIPEAADLVLQAGSMGLGGEVFVMDMGKPIKILDLAKDMIRLATGRENGVALEFTGLRPGEKLFEELLANDEHTRATPHPRLRIAKAREVPADWLPGLIKWVSDEIGPDELTLRRDLKRWVPEYVSSVRPKLRSIEGGQLRAS